MKYIKSLIILFSIICTNASAQYFDVFQVVNVEKYQGKNFILEAKIFYKNKLSNDSWAVLGTVPFDSNNKPLKAPVYNDNSSDYYKEDNWSAYEITGKIDKKAKFLTCNVAIGGTGSYYIDDVKLFIKEGKEKIAVSLKNADFEIDSLKNWQSYNLPKNTKLSLSTDKAYSGKQSLLIDNSNLQVTPTFGNNAELGKYMEVNGVKLYYEVYGKGEPLLLLHGNNVSMSSFSKQLDTLSKKYMVIGLDSRGQGKSTADTTKITYELMAEDVNVFLTKMQLKNVNILGWSDGGNIAVILAMKHSDKVNKMAIMGTVLYNNESSVTAETNKLIRNQVKEMERKALPKTNIDYRLKILLLTEPNINPDSLKQIKSPTLVMAGQYDVVKEKHTKLIADKIPNSKMVIFKGADHEAPTKIQTLFNQTIIKFFDQDK